MKKPVPEQKDILNPEEAITCFGLSRRKFNRFLNNGKKYTFTALYGSRKLIIRTEFEKYLEQNPGVKEELKNGKSRPPKNKA
ncbi:hypothetical protein MKD04_05695 [[Clostridium] innocuum]|nr:hypothetical protein [[Clostridium] innocuum]MCR0502912.1 hypothetical protein [[Clostridium] innocuum]